MVFASMPVLSDKRFAARPVGAQSAMVTVLALTIFSSELTRVVLPTPGPPVMTITLETSATRSAAFLAVSESELRPLFDPRDGLIDFNGGPAGLSNGERLELLGDFALGSVKCSEEDATAACEIVGDDGTALELKAHCCLDQFGRYFEQLFGEGNQLFDRKAAMPLVHRLRQRVRDPGTYPDQRCLLDAELGRDLVGGAKADAPDVAG